VIFNERVFSKTLLIVSEKLVKRILYLRPNSHITDKNISQEVALI